MYKPSTDEERAIESYERIRDFGGHKALGKLSRHEGQPIVFIDGKRFIIGFDIANYKYMARELPADV